MVEQDDDFAAMLEASLAEHEPKDRRTLQAGTQVEGSVVAIGKQYVFVDIGTKVEARIERHELESDSGEVQVAVGDRIKATLVRPNDPDGPVLVTSFRRSTLEARDLELAARSGTPVEGEIRSVVKSGLEIDIGGIRAFCPASQIDVGYTSDLQAFVGQRHFFRVLEVRDRGRSVIVSRKALLEQEREQRAEQLAGELEPESELEGIVHAIKPYGVFVELGGLQGLVHVSEMGHGRVARPEDVVDVGEKVRVKVISIERGENLRDLKISLSMKALMQPQQQDEARAEILTATVQKVEPYGLLVETPTGSGLVPNRELGLPPGSDPRRMFQAGATVDVVLLGKDGSGKLRLSIAKVADVEARRDFAAFKSSKQEREGALGSLGDLLKDVDLGSSSGER